MVLSVGDAKLDEAIVCYALDYASLVRIDGGVDQITAQPSKPRQGVVLGGGEPAVTDHVHDQNCRNLPGFGHGSSLDATEASTKHDQRRMSSMGGSPSANDR
jgi:hypothetical protein